MIGNVITNSLQFHTHSMQMTQGIKQHWLLKKFCNSSVYVACYITENESRIMALHRG